jgi:hypothetical protein
LKTGKTLGNFTGIVPEKQGNPIKEYFAPDISKGLKGSPAK